MESASSFKTNQLCFKSHEIQNTYETETFSTANKRRSSTQQENEQEDDIQNSSLIRGREGLIDKG